MREINRAELIAKHLPAESSIDTELAFLAQQSEEKQSVFEQRLEVIDAYLSMSDPSVGDVDEAAAKVGVSRRQFYRLLTKMRDLGPVRGLTPGVQNVVRRSVATEGLSEPIEAILVQEMRKNPTIKIAELEAVIAKRSKELGVALPSEWKLRKRVHALRGSGLRGSQLEFGHSMVIDQIALDLPVRDRGRVQFAGATLIIDRSTRIIAGAAVTVGDGIGLGIAGALADASRRFSGLSTSSVSISKRLEQLTWIVPPGLEQHAQAALGFVDDGRRQVAAEIVDRGPRRHGELILRLLGDRLGIYSFRTRTELGIEAEPASVESVSDDIEFASKVIGYCVDSWNKKLLQQSTDISPSEKLQRNRLNQIHTDLRSFFVPVFDSVERAFRPSHL